MVSSFYLILVCRLGLNPLIRYRCPHRLGLAMLHGGNWEQELSVHQPLGATFPGMLLASRSLDHPPASKARFLISSRVPYLSYWIILTVTTILIIRTGLTTVKYRPWFHLGY